MALYKINGVINYEGKTINGVQKLSVENFSGTDANYIFNQLDDRTDMDRNLTVRQLNSTTAASSNATKFSTTKYSGVNSLKNSDQSSPENTINHLVSIDKLPLFTTGKVSTFFRVEEPSDKARNQVIFLIGRYDGQYVTDNILRARLMFNWNSSSTGDLLVQKIVSGVATNIYTDTSLSLSYSTWYRFEIDVYEDASNCYITAKVYNTSGTELETSGLQSASDAIFRNDTYRHCGFMTSESLSANAPYTLHDLMEVRL